MPSGMLPAVEIDGVGLVTESDDIIGVLEDVFGPLASGSGKNPPRPRQVARDLAVLLFLMRRDEFVFGSRLTKNRRPRCVRLPSVLASTQLVKEATQ